MTKVNRKVLREELGLLNILVFVLSIFALISLFVDFAFRLSPELSKLLHVLDNVVCIVFLIDFFVRLKNAPDKKEFLKWGWIDFVSSIPALGMARFGRIFRLLRIVRVIRAFQSTKHVFNYLFRNRIQGTFTSVVTFAVITILFSSIAMLEVEAKAPHANIKTAEDALWWSYATITTVGYGDKFPVTTTGRIIAAVLMTVGVGLFGTFTAYVASWFIQVPPPQPIKRVYRKAENVSPEDELTD